MPQSTGDRLVLALSGAILALSVAGGQLSAHGRSPLPAGAICPSVILFHRECAGCGLTRSFLALGGGGLHAAILLNPLGPVLFLWAVFLLLSRMAGIRAHRRGRLVDAAVAAGVAICSLVRLVSFYA